MKRVPDKEASHPDRCNGVTAEVVGRGEGVRYVQCGNSIRVNEFLNAEVKYDYGITLCIQVYSEGKGCWAFLRCFPHSSLIVGYVRWSTLIN